MNTHRIVITTVLLAFVGQSVGLSQQVTVTTLYQFCSQYNCADGYDPVGLIEGSDSNFYGTTAESAGAINGSCGAGCGTLFKITPAGTLTTPWRFGSAFSPSSAGVNPQAGLVQGSDGYFYGTTSTGGTNNEGIVFRLDSSQDVLLVLHQFGGVAYQSDGVSADGGYPGTVLVQGSDGNFYGTTSGGGTNDWGTVFRISSLGAYTILYSFTGGADGKLYPIPGQLVQGNDGSFYGTSSGGETSIINCPQGCGTIFKISPAGTLTTLHQFSGGSLDGKSPGTLIQGSDGYFYGMTSSGGAYGKGILFKISSEGTFTPLYQFGQIVTDGYPPGQLMQASDGNFYGTTTAGGTNGICDNGCGTMFKLSPSGAFTTIYNFDFPSLFRPVGPLIEATDGYFYGTTTAGGTNLAGTVFKLAISCSFAIDQTNTTFSPSGGSGSIGVTTLKNCAWTATNNDGFISIISGSSGLGTGTVSYSVAAYNGDTPRIGIMTIAGQTLTITQDGCAYSLSSASANFNTGGGSSNVTVTANGTNCAWTATSNSGFITIISGSSGTGNGTVGYTVAANTNTLIQSGTMTIAGQTYTITEAAVPCSVAPNSTSASFGSAGGSSNVTVTANGTNCAWTAISNNGFITVSAGSSGTGNGTVGYTVAANTNASVQTGTITIAGQMYTVTEAAAPCSVSPSFTSANFGSSGGSSNETVTANGTNCGWTATSNNGFITITAGSSGSGNGIVSYTVAANTNTVSQSGTMTIAGQTFTVNQAAAPCTVSPDSTSANFGSAGGSSNVTVTANGANCTWTAASNSGFITITSGSSGSGIGTVSYMVAANTNTVSQSGTMTIADQTFTVMQAAAPCIYALLQTNASFGCSAGSGSFGIATSVGCNWSASSDSGWIHTGSIGNGSGTVTYSVDLNASTNPLTGHITVEGLPFTVTEAASPSASSATNSPVITTGLTVTNAVQIGNIAVVTVGETCVFDVGATSPSGLTLYYTWTFGDGASSSRSPVSTSTHVYTTNCTNYIASVTVDDGTYSTSTNLTVAVSCAMNINNLKLQAKFKKVGSDTCTIKGTLPDLPAGFSVTNASVAVDVGDAIVDFRLNAKGSDHNTNGNIKLSYSKKTKIWTFTGNLKGDLKGSWAKYGITSGTVIDSAVPTFPVLFMLQSNTLDTFDAEPPLSYSNKSGTSGTARYLP